MKDTVRYGVIGLTHGHEHVQAIMENPKAELIVCCDLDESKFRKLNLPEQVLFTKNFEDILNMQDLDAVVVALPTPLHAEYSIRLMEAGKHVLCEKPIAVNVEEGLKICEAVKRTGRIFQLGYEVRYSPFQEKVLEVSRSGDIGKVTNVWWNMFTKKANDGWRANRKLRGGKIFDCACHYYNILETWAGAPVKRLCAFGNLIGKTGPCADEIPETAIVMFEYENGVRGVFNLSDSCPNVQNSICGIAGTNGKIDADPYYPYYAGSLKVHAHGGKYQTQIDIKGPASPKHLGFDEQHDSFISAILHGTEVVVTAEQGVQVNRILDAIDQSLATGNVVEL